MVLSDVEDVYQAFHEGGWKRNPIKKRLDVLIHSIGGDPDVAYMIAQIVRNYSAEVTYLVPEFAWSGGTLTCLSADEARLGAHGTLGPIDVTVKPAPEVEIELAGIEYYKRFAAECLRESLKAYRDFGAQPNTRVDSKLLVQLVRDVGAINLGELYRRSAITKEYAARLLTDYMFSKRPHRDTLAKDVADKLVREYPHHAFALDYHNCLGLGLSVKEMDEPEYELNAAVIAAIRTAIEAGAICESTDSPFVGPGEPYRAPFLRLYG
jgi:hypothetical protein